jgi:zinc protease
MSRPLTLTLTLTLALCALCACRKQLPPPRAPLVATPDAPWRYQPPPVAPTPARATAVESHTLANGLTVLLVRRPEVPLVHVALVNRRGGAYDPRVTGAVANLSAEALLSRWTGANSESSHGYHALDHASAALYTSVLPLDLDAHLERLSVALRPGSYAAVHVQRLISRSAALRREVTGDYTLMFETLQGQMLPNEHPASHPARGNSWEIESVRPTHVSEFLSARYSPEHCALVLAGPLPESAVVLDRVGALFAPWSRVAVAPLARPALTWREDGPRGFVFQNGATQQSRVALALPVPAESHVPPAALRVLVALLGEPTSRLNRAIRAERGLTYGLHASLMNDAGATIVFVYGSLRLSEFREAVGGVLRVLEALRTTIDAREFERARAVVVERLRADLESGLGVSYVAAEEFETGRDPAQVEAVLEAARAVTLDDVQAAARATLVRARMHFIAEGYGDTIGSDLEALDFTSVGYFRRE